MEMNDGMHFSTVLYFNNKNAYISGFEQVILLKGQAPDFSFFKENTNIGVANHPR